MKKKNAAALMAAAMAASLLVGCGGGAASSSAAASTAESTPAESTAESTAADTTADGDETLTVWAWDPNFNIYALKQAEAIYQKDHPNFKLNIEENVYSDIETKLITAATSEDYSTLPDLFRCRTTPTTRWSPTSPVSTPSWTTAASTGTTSPRQAG